MKEEENVYVVDKKDNKMDVDDTSAHGGRTRGRHEKDNTILEFLLRLKLREISID